ncbi:MAG TPA: hypothetical protein VGA36_00895 [Nitriliruptorales bacterium]
MVVDERSKHGLHTALESALGAEHADTMMSMLSPVGWADVATKRDLAQLEDRIRREISELRAEMHREIAHSTRTMVFSMTGAMFTVGALAFAAASLV